jgi:hypothetical protein
LACLAAVMQARARVRLGTRVLWAAEAIPLPLKFKISTADDFPAIFLPKAATNWRLESLS